MPRRRGEGRVAGERAVGGRAALERDVPVARVRGAIGQGLELVVALAREVDLRIAVAGEILAGDAHAPDLHVLPAVGLAVLARRLPGLDAPELLAAVPVVMAVVADPQVPAPRAVPVAEQDRQRAEGRSQCHRRAVRSVVGRPDQLVVVADAGAVRGRLEIEVPAEGERRQGRRTLPGRAERRRPRVAAIERPRLVGALEPTVAETPEQDGLTAAQDGQVGHRVAIDIQRVRAGHVGQVRCRIVDRREPEAPADRACVASEERGAVAAGEVQVGAVIVVAIEHRDATADEPAVFAAKRVVDAGRRCLLDEPRRRRCAADVPPRRTADPANATPATATTTTTATATRRPTERFMRSPPRSVASSSCAVPPRQARMLALTPRAPC